MQMWNEFSSEGGHSKLVRQFFWTCAVPLHTLNMYLCIQIYKCMFWNIFLIHGNNASNGFLPRYWRRGVVVHHPEDSLMLCWKVSQGQDLERSIGACDCGHGIWCELVATAPSQQEWYVYLYICIYIYRTLCVRQNLYVHMQIAANIFVFLHSLGSRAAT